ncbi:hypothetical protein BS50DRAFT_655570 [Corynespora cassiicola Philippines]|uniref:Peptidase S8/S53 domain-containing protein n=1 Tax=Corynespora cassiicola Philippines TaxID=1448308 RepID=A0A2T2N4T3_CORCC|nr:hypothetical protein BS50DRAFT_655570 [Corynespora cassiicola Philippines]
MARPIPDEGPLDTHQDHGTHVVGIIVAQENELAFTFTGAAPDGKGYYMIRCGGSLPTPHVAGFYALVGETRGRLDVQSLPKIISSTSKAQLWNDGEIFHDILAPVAQQGAGIVLTRDGTHETAIISARHTFNMESTGDRGFTYKLGLVKSDTGYAFESGTGCPYPAPEPQAVDFLAEDEFRSPSVTVSTRGFVNVKLKLTPPSELNSTCLPVHGGYIPLNSTNN